MMIFIGKTEIRRVSRYLISSVDLAERIDEKIWLNS